MVVEIVPAEEVQKGRGKTKGEKYAKYAQAIAKLVPWIKEQIAKSPDAKIRIRVKDIAKEMGPEFEKKSGTAIYWGVKFVMFHEGIVVDTGTAKDQSKLLVMREGTEKDVLPPSLARVKEPAEEEMPGPEEVEKEE